MLARLEKAGLLDRCTPGKYEPLTEEAVARVHEPSVIEAARALAEAGGGRLDPDTVVSPESYRVAIAAAGACTSAVNAVLGGADTTALCLVRPPTADEIAKVAAFFEAQHKRFTLDPDRADSLAGTAPGAIDRAAWTATARAILNLDEFLTRG